MTVATFAVAPPRVTTNSIASPSDAASPAMEKLGGSSLSVRLTVAGVTVMEPGTVPVTSIVSSSSSRLSSTGVRLNVPV